MGVTIQHTTGMLLFQIDPHSGVPVYRQIMDQVRYHLAAGTLKPGQQLPSIRELAGSLAVNPTTIVKAYTELEHDNVIDLRRGLGAFVSASPPVMDAAERRRRLRTLAGRLAVEARQMGAGDEDIIEAVRQELGRLPEPDADPKSGRAPG